MACVAALLTGCGGPGPQPEAPKPASSAQPKPPTGPRAELVDALSAVPAEGSVLEALPAGIRSAVEQTVGMLSEKERDMLAQKTSPYVRTQPLMHLAVGGTAPDAYLALATEGRAAESIGTALRVAGREVDPGLVPAVKKITELAARRYLREAAIALKWEEAFTASACDDIVRAAFVLGRNDLWLMAARSAVALEPTPSRRLELAEVAALEGDVKTAKTQLDETKVGTNEALEERARRVGELVAAAELATGEAPSAPKEALAYGRALVQLGRWKQLDALLAKHPGLDQKHLGFAELSAASATRGTICPGVPPGAGSMVVCAYAWDASKGAARAVRTYEAAWQAGEGRDSASMERYLGTVHVVPWMYRFVTDREASEREVKKGFGQRLKRFRAAARAASEAEPRFTGLVLFIDTLDAGFAAARERQEGERVALPEPVQKDLAERAEKLAKSQPEERLARAGVLGVAAMLSQERDVADLVELLPEQLEPELRGQRAVLRLWSATVRGRDDLAEKARAELTRQLPGGDNDALARAQLVLLMAEAEASMAGTAEAYSVLGRIASQLTDESVPPELRLRAMLDAAGGAARAGDEARALQLLELTLNGNIPASTSGAANLHTLAAAYLVAKRGEAASAAERRQYAQKLAELLASEQGKQLPVGMRVWAESWLAKLSGKPLPTQQALTKRAGPQVGALLARGTLGTGTVQLSFSFSESGQLTPVVRMMPRLLAIEFPSSKK